MSSTAWASTTDGVREERIYYCQNWRADVSAIVGSAGQMLEWVKYSAYGVPFGLPAGDTDSDGDSDSADDNTINYWSSGYDPRADLNIDGSIDSVDETVFASQFLGTQLGSNTLSSLNVSNFRASNGMRIDAQGTQSCRARALQLALGRWLSRDGSGYIDGINLLTAYGSNPISMRDPFGGASESVAAERWGKCRALNETDATTGSGSWQIQFTIDTATPGECCFLCGGASNCHWGWAAKIVYVSDGHAHRVLQGTALHEEWHGPGQSIAWGGDASTNPDPHASEFRSSVEVSCSTASDQSTTVSVTAETSQPVTLYPGPNGETTRDPNGRGIVKVSGSHRFKCLKCRPSTVAAIDLVPMEGRRTVTVLSSDID